VYDDNCVSKPNYAVRLLGADERDLLDQVVTLGDLHRRWLGLLTHTAFTEYASRNKILIAVSNDSDRLLGYALFDLPRQRVRLAHLCVANDARHQGIARALITELSRLHADRQGIVLRCRRDWPANSYWPSLGFTVLSNRPGRSNKRHLLTTWWRDHEIPDLFSAASADNPRLVVAMDTNVFRDLHEPDRGSDADQSQALLAEWVEDEVELVLTARSKIELNDHPDPKVREQLLATANSLYRTIVGRPQPGQPDAADLLERQVITAIGRERINRDPSLRIDARILAEADAGEADAFVSRDANAVAILAEAAAPLTDLWVSTPTDLVVHLDELRDAANYSPARLLNSGYSVAEAEPRTESDLVPLLSNFAGEKLTEFRSLVRASAQHIGQSGSRLVLRAPDRAVVAAAFSHTAGDALTLSLLRVADTKLAKTIAVQLLHVIRKRACEVDARRIVVTDPRPSEVVVTAMLEMGYQNITTGYEAHLLQGRLTWSEVAAELPALAENRPESSDLSSNEAADLERILWPLKVTDAPLPNFLISIRPEPAAALLNREQVLWDNAELGLSRQHVYYRSPGRSGLEAPGRVLWYISGKVGAAVACSRLEQIVVAHPGTLYRKFRRLGVLDRTVIRKVARDERAMALLFADTEFFDTPVSLERLRQIDCRLEPLASPRRIAASSFFSVCEEGHTQ
jgi:ribosomal protein S18 acetylase RimI-like enzyme/predicted transcriptional regulator